MSEFTIYKASAGSGKTFQLTRHYLELLLKDTDNYKKILAVTFTNKAAGELKHRVVDELVKISGSNPSSSEHFSYLSNILKRDEDLLKKRAKLILRKILQDYGHFSIGTIDHFFQKVLRSFSKEVGINNGYKLELDANTFLSGSVEMLMNDLDQDKELLKWLSKWVDFRIQNDKSWSRIEKDLISIGFEFLKEQLMELMDDEWIKNYSGKSISSFTSVIRKIEKSFEDGMKSFSDEAKSLLQKFGMEASEFKGGAKISVPGYLSVASHDQKFLNRKRPEKAVNTPTEWHKQGLKEEVRLRIVNAWQGGFNDLLIRYLEFLEKNEAIYHTASLISQNIFSLGLSGKLMDYINKYSDQTNSLLINLTSPILNKVIDESPSPFIYEKVGSYYDHFMIDEFQDTSRLQWANFLPLITESLSQDDFSMVVGDVKQSIFRWRNSDWRLMEETAKDDLKRFGVMEKDLDQNWRSRDSIIDFNNMFFEAAPQRIIDKVNDDIKEVKGKSKLLPEKVQSIYSKSNQKKGAGKPGGYVEVAFQEEESESWDLKLPRLVEELQIKHHYRPEDITFLVRKNAQAKEIVKILEAFKEENELDPKCSFNIVSSESYELSNSASVRCIIWAVRYIMDPDELYYKSRLAQEYIGIKRKQLSEKELGNLINLKDDPDAFSQLIPIKLIEEQKNLSYSSGPILLEEIIRILKLQDDSDELPYLLALKDQMIGGIGTGSSLEDISLWWDDQGYKFNVPMTDQKGAMRVMTIHKAKGLEFKVVIMPWCDWEMGSAQIGHLLWVDSSDTVFDQIPLIPMAFGTKMRESSFSGVFSEEKIQIYLDNLNLVYVAFTRAIDRLYAFCPAKSRSKGYEVSRLLKEVLADDINESGEYTFGNPDTIPSYKKDSSDIKKKSFKPFNPNPYNSASGLRKTFDSEAIHHGTVMHEILEKTETLDDLEGAVSQMKDKGELSEIEAQRYFKHLHSLLQRSDLADWFSGKNKVYREKSILVPGGGEFRPDRVIETEEELVILDYKFGEPRPSHERQLRTYSLAMEKMDYAKVKAFLLYPDSGLLHEVT